jgi:hypothetical protein
LPEKTTGFFDFLLPRWNGAFFFRLVALRHLPPSHFGFQVQIPSSTIFRIAQKFREESGKVWYYMSQNSNSEVLWRR